MDYGTLARPAVRALHPYVPGTTIAQARARFGLTQIVKLSSNENPLGASPRALAALAEAGADAHLYVDDAHPELRARIGERYGLSRDHVVVGHGSNDVVRMIFTAFVDRGDEVILAHPTFSLFAKDAALSDGVIVRVPLREGVHDLDAMADAITPRTKLVVVCDPNNPTGTHVAPADFARFLGRLPASVLLLVDQAYREYMPADCVDGVSVAVQRPATIVTRTMSKLYGLASLRFGYGMGEPELIALLERVRLPFNVSRPAATAALAALDDDAFVARTLAINAEGAAYLAAAFERLECAFYPSAANFFALRVPVDATSAYEALLARGIVVRSGDGLSLPGYLRITIGTPHENRALVAALEALLPQWAPAGRAAAV